jgi:transposase
VNVFAIPASSSGHSTVPMSRRRAAVLFRVAISTVNHWVRWRLETGRLPPRRWGGDHSSRLTGERTWLLGRIAAVPDLTLEEIR